MFKTPGAGSPPADSSERPCEFGPARPAWGHHQQSPGLPGHLWLLRFPRFSSRETGGRASQLCNSHEEEHAALKHSRACGGSGAPGHSQEACGVTSIPAAGPPWGPDVLPGWPRTCRGTRGPPITPTHVASPAPHPGSKQTPTASGGSSLLGGEDCHMRRSITVWGGGAISHFSPAFQDGGGPGHRVKSRESRFPPLPKFQKKQRPFISFSLSVVPYNITFNKDGYNGR